MTLQENRKRVLIVDDESSIRDSLQLILGRTYAVEVAESGDRALEVLASAGAAPEKKTPDLVLLDVMMPGLDGLGILERIREDYPALPVIMLTASTAVKTAVQAMKIGAIDYLNKPFDVDELLSLIEETLASGALGREAPSSVTVAKQVRTDVAEVEGDFGCIVGSHLVMREIYNKIEQVAQRDTTVLITGESGTGKELIAREIHRRSKRAGGPFVAINCAAIPETLIESELFGHERGAFTHAVEKRIGHFELASGGTLFLDEIGELSHAVQVKILRFLQEQEFYRVGRSKPISVDVRVLAATNRSLETAIQDGRFRQDLYYRINVVSLEMPPLRQRREDIPSLVDHFICTLAPLYGGKSPKVLPEALALLQAYPWPGNVRELENVIESILALSSDPEIRPSNLPARLRQPQPTGDSKHESVEGNLPFEEAERAFETEIILKALRKANYVQTKAAEILGISRRILKYKMDKLGIRDDPGEGRH